MKTFSTSIYNEIRQHINSNTISTLPKEKLEQFSDALARSQAHAHFSAPEFPRVCDRVKTLLITRSIENSSGQDITTQKTTEIINNKKTPKRHSLRFFAFSVLVIIFAAIVIWVLNHYFNLDLGNH